MQQGCSRTLRSLNGLWEIAPGSAIELPQVWTSRVPVPALVDIADPPYDWASAEYHWYRCTFRLTDDELRCSCVILRIDQAMFGTQVMLNGAIVGGDIACYTSQEYNVSALVLRGAPNELLIRIGRRDTLPPESAVGKDQERAAFIPGIWGDVSLIFTGNPRIARVQVIPRLPASSAEVRVTVENTSASPVKACISSKVATHRTGKAVCPATEILATIPGNGARVVRFTHRIRSPRLWSPDDPFLYDHCVDVSTENEAADALRTPFGMREFRVNGGEFFLNDRRIFLKGGNIAFHRFLSDKDRGTLPWNEEWITRALIEIPKAHNFNFFRNHLGQMYNRWYDIADEHGMLIQNEWQFWTTSGTKEQITKEFTRWLQDNWNHPSIIIWDPLNESSDPVVQREIVPAMKTLDPTRPWESVDFLEEHPYIYSLGPVLTDRKFGFSRALRDIERSVRPTMLNEFLWWWIDKDGKPSSLTEEVAQRWVGKHATIEALLEHQAFLARELVELFRRMDVDAIQPFAYLTCNEGPTSHWFLGSIAELQPKPVMLALRDAFAPFGVSIELWDRHFFTGERRKLNVFLFNDRSRPAAGTLKIGFQRLDGTWMSSRRMRQSVRPSSKKSVSISLEMPRKPGRYTLCAELMERGKCVARSLKPVFVFNDSGKTEEISPVLLAGGSPELRVFLRQANVAVRSVTSKGLMRPGVAIVEGAAVRGRSYISRRKELTDFVAAGNTLVVLEPEFGVEGEMAVEALDGLTLAVERRLDADRGGYDSHVFMEDPAHPIWNGIDPEHLKFFNGGFGGEIVSRHNVTPQVPHTALARCGLGLRVLAAAEIPFGSGRVIVFRLQLRGRLAKHAKSTALYDRRSDPVARRLLINLLTYGLRNS